MIGASTGIRPFQMLVFRSYHIKLLGCLALLMMAHCFAYAKPWRGIVPLQTTRLEVEQQLGSPSMDRGDTVVYDYQNERASIEYSRGSCSVEFSQWNVPRDTVISIWVSVKSDPKSASDLNLAQPKYKKTHDEHRPRVVYYSDEKDGIEYSVDETDGMVWAIRYMPSAADKNLRCHGRSTELITAPDPFATAQFDSYGAISWEEEKVHLDNFAIELKHGSDLVGFIIAYAGRRACPGEAKARASRAKKYVVETRGIQESRVKWIDGGYREKLTVVLQPASPGLPAPVFPTIKPSDVEIIKNCKPKTSKRKKVDC